MRIALRLSLIIALTAFVAGISIAAPYTKTTLPNGLTLIVKPEEGSGIVAVEVFVKAGAAEERESNAGIGGFVARTLLASTRNKRAETVAGVVDEVGGNFQTEWNPDYTEIKAITTSRHFDDAMSLLGDILNNANFEQKWVEQIRQDILSEMNTEGDDVFQTTYSQVINKLYRDNPYGRPVRGYMRTIRNTTKEDLQRFYEQYYVPNNIVVAITGDVTADHALARIKLAFAGTSAKSIPRTRPAAPEELTKSSADMIERPIKTAYLMFGFLAPAATSAEFPAAQVATTALGSGKGSLMFRDLREKKGLAYELGAFYPTLKYQSHILAYIVTDPFRRTESGITTDMMLTEVKSAMLEEFTKLQNQPLSATDLERAKRYTIGRYALEHQRLRDRAFHLGWMEAIGLGCDYDSDYASKIEAVTAEDVQNVARKYFTNYSLTIVLPKGE